jgi:PadR family transcriptional regulator AphA
MSLRYAVLGALADQPRTGYALLKHFQQSLGYAWPASHSQIYPELARLLEAGLIEETQSGPRGSRTYAITKAGLDKTRRWLLETEPDRRVRSEAALRTFFLWLIDPEDAAAQLERERTYWSGILAEFERIQHEPTGTGRKGRTFRIALEGGIRTVRARLAWLEDAIAELRSPEWETRRD